MAFVYKERKQIKKGQKKQNSIKIQDDLKQPSEKCSKSGFNDTRIHHNSNKPVQLSTSKINTIGSNAYLHPIAKVNSLYDNVLKYTIQNSHYPFSYGDISNAPIQRKNASNIDLNDFDLAIIDDIDAKEQAYQIWLSKNLSQAQSKEEMDADYYRGIREVQEKLDNDTREKAYELWLKKGSPQNQDSTNSDDDYFKAKDEVNKIRIKKQLAATSAENHPETSKFINAMTGIGFSADNAKLIWNKILSGKEKQKAQNNAARLDIKNDTQAAIYKKNIGEYLYTNDNDNIRNDNLYYQEVARMVEDKLAVHSTGKELALWSGGYDLSPYATKRGFVTLEESEFGKVLDSIYLSDVWNVIGPLWNIISKTFVKKYIDEGGTKFHVLIRAYDPASVLVRQEVDQIYQQLDTSSEINWHCIVQDIDNSYHEINAKGEVDVTSDADRSTKSEDECLRRLLDFYEARKNNPQYNRAYETMRRGFSDDLASDFEQVREHLSVSRFIKLSREYAHATWEKKGRKEHQSKEKMLEDYLEGEKLATNQLVKERIEKMAYYIWKNKGSPENQSNEQTMNDYYIAERDFYNAVNERKIKIRNDKIAKAAYLLWQSKGSAQNQSKYDMDKDYYDAEKGIVQDNPGFNDWVNKYALLEIAMGIS